MTMNPKSFNCYDQFSLVLASFSIGAVFLKIIKKGFTWYKIMRVSHDCPSAKFRTTSSSQR
ncbi:hypothetical protein CROQUDRAFT_652009 [Cronartium quercuum f. sp. fusiforme G11]|uniref:Uncharacterized protein n=1 Tax=Cronartium quercuum f. sp. fusiforme G11 TaxID=708437 RepID=A0A9P6NRA7_9BASI|nr:hypothetical protein CROQUDRAFT_652009 [Cronartium quercuum f. sp. fusiforme G11]